jgi:hypothetical protein
MITNNIDFFTFHQLMEDTKGLDPMNFIVLQVTQSGSEQDYETIYHNSITGFFRWEEYKEEGLDEFFTCIQYKDGKVF